MEILRIYEHRTSELLPCSVINTPERKLSGHYNVMHGYSMVTLYCTDTSLLYATPNYVHAQYACVLYRYWGLRGYSKPTLK